MNYGTNESLYADYIERYYPGELREVIRRIKNAVPKASVLVMSPMDRGERDSSGQITTPRTLPRLVEIQRQIAAETDVRSSILFRPWAAKEPWRAGMRASRGW